MTRNTASIVSMLAVAAAAAAAATALIVPRAAYAESLSEYPAPVAGSKTRAEVRSELFDQTNMKFTPPTEWSLQQNEVYGLKSGYTRQQALTEFKAKRAEWQAINGEDSGSAYFTKRPPYVNARVMGGPAAQ